MKQTNKQKKKKKNKKKKQKKKKKKNNNQIGEKHRQQANFMGNLCPPPYFYLKCYKWVS